MSSSQPECSSASIPTDIGNVRTRRIADANNWTLGTTVQHVNAERRDFGGMTVNEPLFVAGLLQQFDSAIDSGDRGQAIELLLQVAMSDASGAETVYAPLANPAKYGYPRSS